MVLVEDVSSDSERDEPRPSSPPCPPPAPRPVASPSLFHLVLERKTDFILLLSRSAIIIFTIMYILSIYHSEPQAYYTKALLSSIVTSGLRLHQRLPTLEFSRAFLLHLLREDSAHYLLYSFLFLSGLPMTIVLMPLVTYALLHTASFLSQILTSFPRVKQACVWITDNHIHLLRFVALNEILLMPVLLLTIFVSRSSFLLVFVYYRFLTLRYASQRNPYTRMLFYRSEERRVGKEC